MFGFIKDLIFNPAKWEDPLLRTNYVLEQGQPRHPTSAEELFAFYYQIFQDFMIKVVAKSFLEFKRHPETDIRLEVSTVFLVTDHNFSQEKVPILYETMIFQSQPAGDRYHEGYMKRYATAEAAVIGHEETIKEVLQDYEEQGFPEEGWTVLTQEGKAHPKSWKGYV